MPFQLAHLSSFERCFKKLGSREKEIAELIIRALQSYFQTAHPATSEPYLFESQGRSYRLAFKKLRDKIWEAYLEKHLRILTRLQGNCHFLVFVGNHDQVQQFLRKN